MNRIISSEFKEVNTVCENDENIFSEMILFYFENKIMNEFNKKYPNEKEEKGFFSNEDIRKCFENCLKYLGKEYYGKKNFLSIFYSLSFIKYIYIN